MQAEDSFCAMATAWYDTQKDLPCSCGAATSQGVLVCPAVSCVLSCVPWSQYCAFLKQLLLLTHQCIRSEASVVLFAHGALDGKARLSAATWESVLRRVGLALDLLDYYPDYLRIARYMHLMRSLLLTLRWIHRP